jgi:predicted phage terminase large subunit-like protein
VDATFKDTAKSDKVAIHVWGKKGIDYYLIDVNTGRYDFLTTLHAIKSMHARYKIGFTFIEDKANGSAIINTLRREMSGIIAVNPLGGKESRVQSVLPYLAGNNVKVPREPFTSEVLEEWYSFPTGAHDDNVDAMTQAISQIVYYSRTKELDERDTKKNNDFNGFVNAMTDWG